MSLMSCSRNDVVLLPIPFTDLSSRKVRPAVVVGQSTHPGDLFVVPISSQLRNVDLKLRDWKAAGLNIACGIKSQIATVEIRLIIKRVGTLSLYDQEVLNSQLRQWLGL
jgi:mRNA interferase MazF